MVEAGATPSLVQRCNMCRQDANGACFRTQCGHLFCESCSFQHFGQSQTCPACGMSLQEADITDLTVGLAPAHFRRMMFQEIYKDPDFRSVGQSVVQTAMALHESVAFVIAQMTLEGQRAAESDAELKTEVSRQRHENGRLTMQLRNLSASTEEKLREAEHKLRLREKELIDLQEAYKEKSRKCQAWEKAYGNLRCQTNFSTDRARGGGGGGGGFTPPESPRVGGGARVSNGSYARHDGDRGVDPGGGVASPRHSGGGPPLHAGSSMQRPDDRVRANSPRGGGLGATGRLLGRGSEQHHGGRMYGGGSSHSGPVASWATPRPNSRGDPHRHVSPVLRPRQGHGHYSHSITPSPTFPPQQAHSSLGKFGVTKRPETPLALRGHHYTRGLSPGNRAPGALGSGGAATGGGVVRGGGFFPPSKSSRML